MAWTVPSGWTYTRVYNQTTTTYTAGQSVPSAGNVNSDTINSTDGLCVWRYSQTDTEYGWNLRVSDKTATSYPDMDFTLPWGLDYVSMQSAFYNCTNMVIAPKLPTNVTNMYSCFSNCTSLTTLSSAIPSTVSDMTWCFSRCSALKGEITINATPSSYSYCFNGTVKRIYLLGTGGNLSSLANTSSSGNVRVGPAVITIKCKVNSAWKDGEVRVKVSGAWKDVDSLFVKDNGTWKEC